MNNPVKIEGLDILDLGIEPAPQLIANGSNQGANYWRGRFKGRGFIFTNEQFLKDFEAGEVAVVNLVEDSYEVEDPLDPTNKMTRESFQFVSYATYKQVQRIEAQQGNLVLGRKKLSIEMEVLEKEALKRFDLDDKKVAALQEAV